MKKRARWVNAWGAVWTAAVLAVSLFGDAGRIEGAVAATVAAVATAAPAAALVVAYRRMLDVADELRRKIEIDALALSAGSALVVASVAWVLEEAGIAEDPVAWVLIGMAMGYVGGLVLGYRRYR